MKQSYIIYYAREDKCHISYTSHTLTEYLFPYENTRPNGLNTPRSISDGERKIERNLHEIREGEVREDREMVFQPSRPEMNQRERSVTFAQKKSFGGEARLAVTLAISLLLTKFRCSLFQNFYFPPSLFLPGSFNPMARRRHMTSWGHSWEYVKAERESALNYHFSFPLFSTLFRI